MKDGKPYRPSNGTEGMYFIAEFCEQCIHEKWMHTQCEGDKKCDILSRSLIYDLDDPEYPEEWIYKDGKPICTEHQHWDWWGGPWGNDFQEPPPEPINDPNQLMFPFMIDEIIETETIEEMYVEQAN